MGWDEWNRGWGGGFRVTCISCIGEAYMQIDYGCVRVSACVVESIESGGLLLSRSGDEVVQCRVADRQQSLAIAHNT